MSEVQSIEAVMTGEQLFNDLPFGQIPGQLSIEQACEPDAAAAESIYKGDQILYTRGQGATCLECES